MMKCFRITVYLEGISLLILLGIAMPLKYVYGEPMAVKVAGWIHGLLFIAYAGCLASIRTEHHWPMRRVLLAFLAAVLPFGTFVFDWTVCRENVSHGS